MSLATVTPEPRNTSPALELSDPTLLQTTSFVNGAFLAPDTPADLPVENPYDNSVVATVHSTSDAAVAAALKGAAAGLTTWRGTPVDERCALLDRLLALMREHADDLARIIVAENGKPLAEALAEVAYGASYVAQVRASAYTASHGTRCAGLSGGQLGLVLREPVGVVLAVTPWNFPVAMLARKLAPALAAGCAVVAKPSERTPLAALAVAELARRAGLPPGVLAVLPSAASAAVCEAALAHPAVRLLSFTGSTRVGRLLAAAAAPRLQRTAMELGGLAPLIVARDSDVAAAADGLFRNKFRNAGQSCVSINRVYAHEAVAPELVERVAARMRQDLALGCGTKPGVTLGPLIDRAAAARVRAQIADAVKRGARVACEVPVPPGEDPGVFVPPTLLVDVPDDAECLRTETFGPVIALQTFDDLHDAVAKANDTDMGLAAYVYSRSLSTATRVARALEVGMVGVNDVAISECRTCFGGVKQSGSGREGSEFGLDDYTEAKYVLMNHGSE